MPSTNKTENLGLNQWIPTDYPTMEDFNADNARIDGITAASIPQTAIAGQGNVNGALSSLSENKANLDGAAFTGTVGAPLISVNATTAYPSFRLLGTGSYSASLIADTALNILTLRLTDGQNNYDYRLRETIFAPVGNAVTDLGGSSSKWKDLYIQNAPIVGSDQRIKRDISQLEISITTKLLMSITPVEYRLIDGSSGRLHYGFIAQDVEEALSKAELSTLDFAGFVKSPILDDDGIETGDYVYALRLEEFIPILWAHQQDLERRMQALEAR